MNTIFEIMEHIEVTYHFRVTITFETSGAWTVRNMHTSEVLFSGLDPSEFVTRYFEWEHKQNVK